MTTKTGIKSKTRQPRIEKGVRDGGKFTFGTKQRSPISVGERQTYAQRAELLAGNGFVPATTLSAAASPSTTAAIDEWYARASVATERTGDGTSYVSMGRGQGANRMRYQGGGVDIRMMSKASIKRTSAEHGNATVKVPVAVSVDGKAPVQGDVLVTQTGKDTWKVTAMGGSGDTEAEKKLEEAVTAVLESRRVTGSIARAGDLLEKRQAREAAEGAAISPVGVSQFIDGMGYDKATQTIGTEINGQFYGHKGSPDLFKRVMDSERKGALFNQLVKKGARVEVQNCENCGRFSVASVEHTCPKDHQAPAPANEARLEADRKAALRIAAARGNAALKPAPSAAPAPAVPPQPVNAYAPKPISQLEARTRMSDLLKLPAGSQVLVDGKPMFKNAYAGEQFGHPDNKNLLQVGFGAGGYNREVSVNAMRDGYVDVRPMPKIATAPEAAHLMQQARYLKKGDKVILNSNELYFDRADEDGSVRLSVTPGGAEDERYTVDSETLARGVYRMSIPAELTRERLGQTPAPIIPIRNKEDYLRNVRMMQASAAKAGFRFAVEQGTGMPGLRTETGLSTKVDDEGGIAEGHVGLRDEQYKGTAEAMHKWTVANGQALRELAAATGRGKGNNAWRLDAHETLKPAQPAAPAARTAPVKRTEAPRPAHLENPIMSPAEFARELAPLKAKARRAGFEINANGVQKVCESSCSTDSYFARIMVDDEGTMHRMVNERPVEAFDEKHRKAQELEAWTASEAKAMARITDAERRRSLPAGQVRRPVAV